MIQCHLVRAGSSNYVYVQARDSTSKAPSTGLTTITTLVSKDGGTFVATTNAVTELAGASPGVYRVLLTTTESTADTVDVIFKIAPGTVEFWCGSLNLMTAGGSTACHIRCFMIPDLHVSLTGAGFSAATDSLEKIRDKFDADIVPVLNTGVTVTDFSGTGWLSRMASMIRKWTDEPSSNIKFDSATLQLMIQQSIREMFTDVLINADRQLTARYTITIVQDVIEYVLPPNVGTILRVASMDALTDHPTQEVPPSTPWSPTALGWYVEGNMLRLRTLNVLEPDETIEILYIPNGDFRPHNGTTTSISADGLTVVLGATPTDGTLDRRPNAFGGYVFRLLNSADGTAPNEQERLVASHDNASRTLVLRRPLNPIPAGDALAYELVPAIPAIFEDVLVVHVARRICEANGNVQRANMLMRTYAEKARSMRLQISKTQFQEAKRFDGRTTSNIDFGAQWSYV